MYVCTYVRLFVCMYACTFVCMYVFVDFWIEIILGGYYDHGYYDHGVFAVMDIMTMLDFNSHCLMYVCMW
jgi:hypothetical protein